MTISMYQASVPVLTRMLDNLSQVLHKAEAHADVNKIPHATLIDARLAPDMFPLARQIQIVSDTAKGLVARLAGAEVPSYADTETTFAELQQRIAKTSAFVSGFTPSQINGTEERLITLRVRGEELHLDGLPYLLHFAMPNFYFHITAAYCILRHHGVELGKLDYLGGVNKPTKAAA